MEGASVFAALASDTIRRIRTKLFIVGANGSRDLILHDGKVIQFIDHCNINLRGARRAMSAISTLSCGKGMAGRRGEYAGVILLLVACSFIYKKHLKFSSFSAVLAVQFTEIIWM